MDGSPVTHGYADVGDVPTSVLAPEEQVSGLGSTSDRGAVAHLPTRGIGQRDAELLVNQHGEAGAVLVLVSNAWPRRGKLVRGSHVIHRHTDHIFAHTTHRAPTRRRRAGRRCTGRGRGGSVVPTATSGVSRSGGRSTGGRARRSAGRSAGGRARFGSQRLPPGVTLGRLLRGSSARGGAGFGCPLGGTLFSPLCGGSARRCTGLGGTLFSPLIGPLCGLFRVGGNSGGARFGSLFGFPGGGLPLGAAFGGTPGGGALRCGLLSGGLLYSGALGGTLGLPVSAAFGGAAFGGALGGALGLPLRLFPGFLPGSPLLGQPGGLRRGLLLRCGLLRRFPGRLALGGALLGETPGLRGGGLRGGLTVSSGLLGRQVGFGNGNLLDLRRLHLRYGLRLGLGDRHGHGLGSGFALLGRPGFRTLR